MAKKNGKKSLANPGRADEWESAAAGADFLNLKEDGDICQFVPLTIPAGKDKPKFKGKKGETTRKYLFAVLNLESKMVEIMEVSGKVNNQLKARFARTWRSEVLSMTRHGKAKSQDTKYVFAVEGKASEVKDIDLDILFEEGKNSLLATLEYESK